MRAIWSGTVSFGLVALPVQLFSATEERGVSLREVHATDGGRVRHRRWCEAEEQIIPYEEVGRAWELPDGRLVPLSEVELESLPLPTRKVAEVVGFVRGEDIDPISYGRAYYAAASGPGADRPYALLTEALARSGMVGVVRVAIRSRERLATLRPRRGLLVLQLLLWADEVREPAGLEPSTAPVTDRELDLADILIRELTGVELADIHDEYRHALEALIEAKLAGGEVEALPQPPAAQPADLMAVLEASVRAARDGES